MKTFRLIGFFASLLFAFCGAAEDINSDSASKTGSVLLMVNGPVEVAEAGSDLWKPGQLKQSLKPGDRVRTGKTGNAIVRLPTANLLRVQPSTIFEIPGR
jgi:hypothetical protein